MDSQFVADWSSSSIGDAFAPLGGEDDGLIELLWCNGHVVMQNQAPRKPLPRPGKVAAAAVAVAAQEVHELAPTTPWFQYPDGDLFSEMFGEMERTDAGRVWKAEEEERSAATALGGSELMPMTARVPREKAGWGRGADSDASEGVVAVTDAGESSSVLTTIGSRSVCGSNHVQTPPADTTAGDSAPSPPPPPPPVGYRTSSTPARSSHHDASTTMTSSSLRSRPPGPGVASRKRQKQSDSIDHHHHQPAESLSEDMEYESAAATTRELAQKLTTSKRRRAAEVHNLSERRRRDRINEKMKALQELIPHCNKTDKASMLDEAIEYLKLLQMQLQMMWMGGGMAAAAAAPAPAASVHQYMQRLASMPRMPPFMPAAAQAQSSPGSHLPVVGTHARYLAVEHLQPPPSAMGIMSFYQLAAAKNPQQNPEPPSPVVPGGNHTAGAAS